jgi:hypothetical protein
MDRAGLVRRALGAVMALALLLAVLGSALLVLLLTQPFSGPTGISFEPAGQRAGQVGAVVTMVVLLVTWAAFVWWWRQVGPSRRRRLVVALLMPAMPVAVLIAGGGFMDFLVDRAAPHSDRAMCW